MTYYYTHTGHDQKIINYYFDFDFLNLMTDESIF